jgi:hypothetical protein
MKVNFSEDGILNERNEADLKVSVVEWDGIDCKDNELYELPIDSYEVKDGQLLIKIDKCSLLKAMNLK